MDIDFLNINLSTGSDLTKYWTVEVARASVTLDNRQSSHIVGAADDGALHMYEGKIITYNRKLIHQGKGTNLPVILSEAKNQLRQYISP